MIEVEVTPLLKYFYHMNSLSVKGNTKTDKLVVGRRKEFGFDAMTFMLPILTFQTTVNVVVTDLIHLGMVCRKFVLKHCPVPVTAPLTLVGYVTHTRMIDTVCVPKMDEY